MDLNCDMGELPEAIADGTQEALMRWVTSVNIACGGHAGDEQTMTTTIEQALRWKLAIGAHPGYPDRANFGRMEMKLPPSEIAASVFEQVRALAEIAARCGARLVHIKPHGALYNPQSRAGRRDCGRGRAMEPRCSSCGHGRLADAGCLSRSRFHRRRRSFRRQALRPGWNSALAQI